MTSRLAASVAAAAFAGTAVLGMSAPAIAQTTPDYTAVSAAGASDSTPAPGQTVEFTSGDGSFVPGSDVEVRVLNQTFTVQANTRGAAILRFTIPTNTRPGNYEVVFSNATNTVRVPFTVQGSTTSGAAAGSGAGQLPRTGSDDLVALTAAGAGLVAAGALVVVAARRRREDAPAGLA